MATVKLILQQPYLPQSDKDKEAGKPKKLNPEETRLYAFLILDRDHVIKIKTKYRILPKTWNFETQSKNDKLAGSLEFNADLAKLKSDINDKYEELRKQFPDMTFEQISQTLKTYGKTSDIPMLDTNKDFFAVMDEYIKHLKGEVAEATVKKFTTLKNSLIAFGEDNKKFQTMTFSLIDHRFISEYRNYLRNQEPRGRQKRRPENDQNGLLLSTQGKYIECLKSFLKWAEQWGYNKYKTYKEFTAISEADKKRKKADQEIVALTLSELRQFYTHKFEPHQDHLDRVRDLFCFGAFTGQRWGDYSRFDKSQIQDNVWSFVADKTLKRTEIDLTGFMSTALDILKKYDYKLPKITAQKFNLYLKEAAKVAKIDADTKISRYVNTKEIVISGPKSEFLSSHSARRSTVSILLNDFNINPVIVMGITGHTDLKTLQKYIAKDRGARKEAISKTKSITEAPLLIVKSKAG